jgi:hypothetical protein
MLVIVALMFHPITAPARPSGALMFRTPYQLQAAPRLTLTLAEPPRIA